MRKITAVLMALVLALSLFACGKEPEQSDTPGSNIQQGTVILPKPQDNENGQNGEYPSADDPLPTQPEEPQKPQEDKKDEPQKPENNAGENKPAKEEKPNNSGGNTTVPSGEYRSV